MEYPSSSPYVVSVGGTSLFTNADGTYSQEAAWVAGSGGPSLFEYLPYWQSTVTPQHGIITITAPRSVLGNPATGTLLKPTSAETYEYVGNPAKISGAPLNGLLEAGDTAGPGAAYKVGSTC